MRNNWDSKRSIRELRDTPLLLLSSLKVPPTATRTRTKAQAQES